MPGWLSWASESGPKKARPPKTVETTLRELKIRHFDEDLLEMPIKKLREHFGYSTTDHLRMGEFLRNVIWQLYERIQAGDRPDFYNKHGMIRGMWYHIKAPLSRYKDLRGDRYSLMLNELATLVRKGLVTYKDFNFRDKDENNHRIGLENPHIIMLAEKDGFLTIQEDLHALYGFTVITLGGDPSLMTVHFLVTHMQEAGVDLSQEFACFTLADFDPDGQEVGEVFVQHLKDSGIRKVRSFTQFGRNDRDHLDLIVPTNLPPGVSVTDVRYLLKPKVRKQKAAKWVKLTGGVPGPPKEKLRYGIQADVFKMEWIHHLVEEAVTPYLHVDSDVVHRRATMTQLEKLLKEVILYKVLHPEVTVS
jgi:hypothetical protein